MDSSKIRRGNETVHTKWNLNQAILSGDSMLILSYKLLEKYPNEIQKLLLKLFNDTALLICEGQQLDIDFESQNEVEYLSYINMIEYKTAVLLGSSLKMGALINSADNSTSDLLYKCGVNLGIAFQIQDDYLDLFGDEKIIGKKIGGDVLENKKTILYHLCFLNANKSQAVASASPNFSNENTRNLNEHHETYHFLYLRPQGREGISDCWDSSYQMSLTNNGISYCEIYSKSTQIVGCTSPDDTACGYLWQYNNYTISNYLRNIISNAPPYVSFGFGQIR